MDSLRKSFRPRTSAGAVEDIEHQPILSTHRRSEDDYSMRSSDLGQNREVIVKIDSGDDNRDPSQRGKGRSSGLWRGSSYEFWSDDGRGGGSGGGGETSGSDGFDFHRKETEDPPSQMIRQFLNKQKDVGGDMPLDLDMEMDELQTRQNPNDNFPRNLPPISDRSFNNNRGGGSNAREIKVSFQDDPDDSTDDDDDVRQYKTRRRSSNLNTAADNNNNNNGEVLSCSSFQRRASFWNKKKSQSRLMDSSIPPEPMSGKLGKASPMKSAVNSRTSGFLGRVSGMLSKGDDDEDDSLVDEDIPNEFRKNELDALTLLQWISLVIIISVLITTLSIKKWKKYAFHGLEIWEWEVLVLALICGRLVSGWAIRVVVFFIERNFLLRKRVLYFVYGLRKAVQNCIWLALVLLSWQCLFDHKVDGQNKVLTFVNRFMFCMLAASLLWLLKTLMVKVLASSFHVSTFFDRIQDSIFNQYIIETLSGPPLVEIQSIQEEEEITRDEVSRLERAGAVLPADLRRSALESQSQNRNTGKIVGSGILKPPSSFSTNPNAEGIKIDHLHKLNTQNVSAWNMKRLMKIVRHGFRSTLDEQILETTQYDDSTTEIRSEVEAKIAARKIFRNVARPQKKFIYLKDLMRYLHEEEAAKAMTLVEGSPDGERISKTALKNWVVNAFRERRALALTLNDTKTAVKKLHTMVNVLVIILIVIVCLVILGIATSKFLLFLCSQLVLVAFVFGNTCKQIFEALVFLFAMHPFDVGDRCEIDGVQLVVEEMNILTTVFLRYDNLKVIFPNSTLALKPICNFYRSPDMGDSVDFSIHIGTPKDKIDLMKQKIISYIEERMDHWYTGPSVVLMNFEDLNKLKMSVWLRHKINHQDQGEKFMRRELLVYEMVKIFKELGIDYRLYPFDINVCSMPAVTSSRLPPTWPSSSHVRKSESITSLDTLK